MLPFIGCVYIFRGRVPSSDRVDISLAVVAVSIGREHRVCWLQSCLGRSGHSGVRYPIAYSGVVASPSYHKPVSLFILETELPEVSCLKELTGVEGFLNRTDIDREFEETAKKYGTKLECIWLITVDQGWRVSKYVLRMGV